MSRTFAIADLHGRFDLLYMCYEKIIVLGERGDTIVHLGDYVDRGPHSKHIIEFLMDEKTIPVGMKRVVLKGNHEDMMVQTLETPLQPNWWIGNGGGTTLLSYGHPTYGPYSPGVVPDAHTAWLNALQFMHVDKHRVFVHAWVDSSVPLEKQKPEKMMWELYGPNARYGHRLTGRHVVHGHHQFADGPKLYKGRTDLDTFAWLTGRIVIGVFDNDVAGGPTEIIEVFGDRDPRYSEAA